MFFYSQTKQQSLPNIHCLIIFFLSDKCVEVDTLMCELQFYFCLTLYDCHLTRLTNTPASALCFVSTPPTSVTTTTTTIYFQSWCPPQSAVCPTKLSVAVCQSHIKSQPWGWGGGGTEQEGRWETMVTVGWTSGRHTYILIHYNTLLI